MLLPIFAILVAPILPVFAGVVDVVPAALLVGLEVVQPVLVFLLPVVPGIVPAIYALLPLLVAVLGAVGPVRPLLRSLSRTCGALNTTASSARTLGGKLTRAVCQGRATSDATCDSEEIADIAAAGPLRGLIARA